MYLIQLKHVFLPGQKIKVNIIQFQVKNPTALFKLQKFLLDYIQDDIGGPVVINTADNRLGSPAVWTLVGINSFTPNPQGIPIV